MTGPEVVPVLQANDGRGLTKLQRDVGEGVTARGRHGKQLQVLDALRCRCVTGTREEMSLFAGGGIFR